MKKINILAAGLLSLMVIALSSCSGEQDSPQPDKKPLRFKAEIMSRAIPFASVSSVYVSAFCDGELFVDNEEFKGGDDGFFSSLAAHYFPEEGKHLDIYLYGPSSSVLLKNAGADGKLVINSEQKKLINFRVDPDIEKQIDFIAGKVSGKVGKTDFSVITLTRAMTLVNMSMDNTNKDYVVKVAGVRIGGFVDTGSYDFDTNSWTVKSGAKPGVCQSLFDEVEVAELTSFGTYGTALLIPQVLKAWRPEADPANEAGGAYGSLLVQISDAATGKILYPESADQAAVKPGFDWLAFPLADLEGQSIRRISIICDFSGMGGYTDPQSVNPGVPLSKGKPGVSLIVK